MIRNNHITALLPHKSESKQGRINEIKILSECLDQHHPSISYLKLRGSNKSLLQIQDIVQMVQESALSLCLPSEIAIEAQLIGSKKGSRMLAKLQQAGFNALEVPASVIYQDGVFAKFIREAFSINVVKVGIAKSCTDPGNSPQNFTDKIDVAQQHNADHILLEGGIGGNLGVYHPIEEPNPLLVDEAVAKISDKTRCIIGGGNTLWRDIYGPETHIGDIWNFTNINKPFYTGFGNDYWSRLREFRLKLKGMAETRQFNNISWTDIVGSESFSKDIMSILPQLAQADDEELEDRIMDILFRDAELEEERDSKGIAEFLIGGITVLPYEGEGGE